MKHPVLKWVLIYLVCLVVIPIVYLLYTASRYKPHGDLGKDTPKIGAVRQLQLALELYADKHENKFPQVPPGCQNVQVLANYLTPSIIGKIPHDLQISQGWPDFQYAVWADGTGYVLVAKLTKSYNPALRSDIDGNILGCDCNDPNYCAIAPAR